jgi:hypothetical protein
MINVSDLQTVNPVLILGAMAVNTLAHVATLAARSITRAAGVALVAASAVCAFVVAVVLALVAGRRELAVCAGVVGLALFVAAYPMVVVGAAAVALFAYVTYPRSK